LLLYKVQVKLVLIVSNNLHALMSFEILFVNAQIHDARDNANGNRLQLKLFWKWIKVTRSVKTKLSQVPFHTIIQMSKNMRVTYFVYISISNCKQRHERKERAIYAHKVFIGLVSLNLRQRNAQKSYA